MKPPVPYFDPSTHPNEETHRRIMAKLTKMTPEEVFQTAVLAGIYTPDGQLTAPYTSEEPSPSRPTD